MATRGHYGAMDDSRQQTPDNDDNVPGSRHLIAAPTPPSLSSHFTMSK